MVLFHLQRTPITISRTFVKTACACFSGVNFRVRAGLLAILFTIVSVNSYSQLSLKGNVKHSFGQPIPFATVQIFNDSTELYTTVSDSLGNFTIELADVNKHGNYYIQATWLKLRSTKTPITAEPATYQLIIVADKNTLSEVIVNSSQSIFTRKGDRFIFYPARVLTQGSNALDMMRHVPLVKFDSKSEMISIINRQGTVVLINNKKTYMPKEMIIQMLRSLPAENIKSIEIITNPGSEYESNITGGIININIKRQLNEGWRGNLSVTSQQGPYNTSILNGSVAYRKNKMVVQLIPFINNSYNFYTKQNTIKYSGHSENIDYRYKRKYTVLGGGLNIDYENSNKLFLSYNGFLSNVSGKSNTGSVTKFYLSDINNTDSSIISPSDNKDRYIYNFGNVNCRFNFDSLARIFLDYNIDYNHFYQKNNNQGIFTRLDKDGNFIGDNEGYKNILPQKFFNVSQKLEYSRPVYDARVTAGVQLSHTRVKNNLNYNDWNNAVNGYEVNSYLTNDFSYKEKYYAGFISISKQFSDKFSGSAGVRAEQTAYTSSEKNNKISVDSNYLNFFPSVSLSYSHNKHNQFSINFSRKIKRPDIEMLFPGRNWFNDHYYKENNPFLQPVIYSNAEFSYTFQQKYNLIVAYSFAKNQYDNFIVPATENGIQRLKNTYVNYGTKKNVGVTLNLNQSFFKDKLESQLTTTLNFVSYKGIVTTAPISVKNCNYSITFDNSFYISVKKKIAGFATLNVLGPTENISSKTVNTISYIDVGVKKVIHKKFIVSIFLNDALNGSSVIRNYQQPNGQVISNFNKINSYNRSAFVRVQYVFGNSGVKTNKSRKVANDDLKSRIKN